MTRHSPYVLSLLKGIVLIVSLVVFATAGGSSSWAASLNESLASWPFANCAAWWLTVIFASLLIVFPFTIAQDHVMRMAQGHDEEMPASFWLNGFAIELMLGTAVGSVTTACMWYSPSTWWLILSALWTGYQTLFPVLHARLAVTADHGTTSAGKLGETLTPLLSDAGYDVSGIYVLDEETMNADTDIVFIRKDGKWNVYIPSDWASSWPENEIAAAVLHEARMRSPAIRTAEIILHAAESLLIFGGFALLFAQFNSFAPIHDLAVAPYLLAWMVFATFVFRIGAFAMCRAWVYRADAGVAAQMKNSGPLVQAIERGSSQAPAFLDYPRWAEILFCHSPSAARRIARLKTS